LLCSPQQGNVAYFAGKGLAKILPVTPVLAEFLQGASRMSALKTAFDKAMADSKNLSERPDNATLLKIYALYKQGSTGDNEEKKPGFGDMVARAKSENRLFSCKNLP
jgi:hypothetical protein